MFRVEAAPLPCRYANHMSMISTVQTPHIGSNRMFGLDGNCNEAQDSCLASCGVNRNWTQSLASKLARQEVYKMPTYFTLPLCISSV